MRDLILPPSRSLRFCTASPRTLTSWVLYVLRSTVLSKIWIPGEYNLCASAWPTVSPGVPGRSHEIAASLVRWPSTTNSTQRHVNRRRMDCRQHYGLCTSIRSSSRPLHFPRSRFIQPERWLGEEAKNFQKYILTFSAGGRVCIGKNITYLEQSLLVAALVRRYDFELPSQAWKMEWEEYFNSWPKQLPVRFTRRP